MCNSRSCLLPASVLWAALVLIAVCWTLPATAQQVLPSPTTAPALAPKQAGGSSTDIHLDTPAPTAGGTSEAGAFQSPKLLKHPAPVYPELAHLNRVEGVVRIRFSIDETGHVTDVAVTKTSGSVMLDSLVRDHALREWTFQPALLDGKPVAGGVEKDFEFKLDPNEQRLLAEKRLALPVGIPEPPYPKEALALQPPPKGQCTVGVRWTKAGLVDLIYLPQGSGSNALDRAALRFAYQNWRTDLATATKDEAFTKVINFSPP